MIKHTLSATVMWAVLFAARLVILLAGLVVVPIGVLTTKEVPSSRPHRWPAWRLKKMHKIFWLWDNDRDGSMGDVRGNYEDFQRPSPIKDSTYLKAVYWLAIRNPANNFSRFMKPNSVDVRELEIEKLGGDSPVVKGAKTSWQFTKGKGRVFTYYGFYLLKPYKDGYLNVRLGHKISEKHIGKSYDSDPQKALKGFTIRILIDRK